MPPSNDSPGVSPLAVAVEALYVTFAPYSASGLHGCPCCTDDTHSHQLVQTPLKDLQSVDLRRYATKAITTWGDINHFKHFLPRMLELVWELGVDLSIIFAKLDYARWHSWPAAEQAAVRQFLLTFWMDFQSQTEPTESVADVLRAIACTGEPLELFVNHGTARPSTATAPFAKDPAS